MNYKDNKKVKYDMWLKKEKWLKENSPKSQLLGNYILPMNPELGFFITVDCLQISQEFFKDEYDQIYKSYFSVMKKLDEYYKNQYK